MSRHQPQRPASKSPLAGEGTPRRALLWADRGRHGPAAEAAAIRARAAAIAGDPAEDAIVRAAAVSLCNPARSIVMPLD
jgi:uncharacterized caspase-like protein